MTARRSAEAASALVPDQKHALSGQERRIPPGLKSRRSLRPGLVKRGLVAFTPSSRSRPLRAQLCGGLLISLNSPLKSTLSPVLPKLLRLSSYV